MQKAPNRKSELEETRERILQKLIEGKKQDFERYRMEDEAVRRLEEEIARWESLGQKITPSFAAVKGGGDDGDRVARSVEEVEPLLAMLRPKVGPLAAHRMAIERDVESVKDPKQRLVLQLYYIDGYTLEAAADALHISYTWAWQLRNRAFKAIICESL